MIFITVLMTVTCCETAALVIQVIICVINLIKSGSSNFCKDLPLFHPVIWRCSEMNTSGMTKMQRDPDQTASSDLKSTLIANHSCRNMKLGSQRCTIA